MRISDLWQRPAQLGDGRATLVFYLWRRPAQLGDSLRNAYILSLATTSATWQRLRNAYLFIFGDGHCNLVTACATHIFLSLATASATWRQPTQFVNSRSYETGRDQCKAQLLSLASCQWNAHLIFVVVAVSANAEMLDPDDNALGK